MAVIGAGQMGHGIAQVFAQGGYRVSLMDKYPEALEKAKSRISEGLARLVQKGRVTEEEARSCAGRVSYTGDMNEALQGIDVMVEAVPELPELKKEVFRDADKAAPAGAVLASNTSNIRISDMAEQTSRPERVVGMHFFNPAPVMKLVEVIPNPRTEPSVVEYAADVCRKLGKTPVKVLKDSPGFIVNRINAADMLFFSLVVDAGVATPAEVDAYAKGQGMPMGPFELLDFVGIDVAHDSLQYFSKAISPEYGKAKSIARLYGEKRLGKKTGGGFYEWVEGRARIEQAAPTDKVTLMDVFAIEINEAVKLIEEGVALPGDIDTAVTLGMNRPFGPISVARSFTSSEIASRLNELSARFGCAVFAPAASIAGGKLREAIEDRKAEPKAEPKAQAKAGPVAVERLGGGVARIVLDRPRRNTINAEALDALDRAITELWDDRETAVVLVGGRGDTFSAGAELSQFFSNSVDFMEFSRKGQRVFRRLSELPKLTVAVMKGYALGGGLELAMSCDLRLCADETQIGLPEVTLGLVPGWSGTQRAVKLLGAARASELILAGRRMTAARAYEIGLVHAVFPPRDIEEAAVGYAKELASTVAPVSVMLAKRLINKAAEGGSDAGLEMEAASLGVLYGTEDLKEGIAAFLGKRAPRFRGR